MKLKHYNDMYVGPNYKITWPNYDDYEEGLTPEVTKVRVLKRYLDSFLVTDLDHHIQYELYFNLLVDCEIETT